MVYKRFYIQLIIRTIFIFLNLFWFSFILLQPFLVYTFITAILLLIIQFSLFIHYVNKTNRELSRFFISLKDEYSSLKLSSEKKGSFSVLSDILNETQEIIRNARLEKEKQYHFLDFIIQNLNTGIIVFDESGKSIHYNNAILKLLTINSVKDIREFDELKKGLSKKIIFLKPERSEIIKINISGKLMILHFQKHIMKFDGIEIMLLSIQDIKNELETNELESWKKLIRVLNHEVMNSITPISTLTHASEKSMQNIVKNYNALVHTEDYNDIIINLRSIEKRSKGLADFINKYRSLTKNPEIHTANIKLSEMLDHISTLFQDRMNQVDIKLNIEVNPKSTILHADPNLIEQVIINIMKNAIEAFDNQNNKIINIVACRNTDNHLTITITDNGEGISEEIHDDIFTPFFTTRKQGSGIGLSLSRQIMKLHGGGIEVISSKNKGTNIILRF